MCTGLDFYDALNEPDPADTDEVVRWADDASAVLRQISFRQRYTDKAGKEHAVPSAVRNDVDTLRAAVDRFRRTVREADGDDPVAALATVRAADRTLYLDAAAREAGRRLQEFAATRCA